MLILGYTLAHYFLPGHSNNHKSKLLHNSSIAMIILIFMAYQIALRSIPLTGVKILGYASNISISDVVNLTNQKRAEDGLSSLTVSSQLTEAAQAKGADMLAKNYWAHVAPDGTQPWKFFADVGYKYRYAGENLARDFSNAGSAVDAWMASPSHRENMLSPKYQEIGVAVVEGDLNGVDTTIIVQLFGTKYVDTTPELPVASAQNISSTNSESTPTVTLVPTQTTSEKVPTPTSSYNFVASAQEPPSGSSDTNHFQVLISPFKTTKSLSIVTTVVLLSIMVMDGIIVHRRGISRISGRTAAHIAFLGMILIVVLIAKAGLVL